MLNILRRIISWLCGKFYPIYIPQEFRNMKGTKILHISDTPYGVYHYIKRLIRVVKPDVIIHTGDMVDNIKVGRHSEALGIYKKCVSELLEILHKSHAKQIYLVPGNHDILIYLKEKAPWANVVEEGSIITIENTKIGLAHKKSNLPNDALYCMYGHGWSKDSWKPEKNVMGSKCFFNGKLNVHLMVLPEHKICYLPYLKLSKLCG